MKGSGVHAANAALEMRWRRVARYAGRALLLRCPECGGARLWDRPLRMRARCPACGLHTQRREEEDYFLGAILVNLVVAELLLAGALLVVLVATWPDPPWTFLEYGGVALMVLAPLTLYPFTKTLWLAVDLAVRPALPEERTPPS